jgi:Ca2+-binding RTX toxin-like protein
MRLSTLSAATLAVSLLVLLSCGATAQARLAHDPCGDDAAPRTLPVENYVTRVCMTKFEVPPHRTMTDPSPYDSATQCPIGWYVYDNTLGHEWGDYWTYRGEWVTWSPLAGTHSRKSVHPGYHNWGSWNWPTRTILSCHKLDPLAVAARSDEDPQPVGPDHVIVHGNADDADRGTAHRDDIEGGKGDDTLSGGKGADELLGGPGADHLYGGAGADELFDDEGRDVLFGGPGNDRFSTKDGNHDVVECGPGEDVAVGDPHDTFNDCEHVYTSDADTPAHPPVIG